MVQSNFSFRTPLYSTSCPVKKGKKSWKRGCSLLRTISYVPTKFTPISWQRRGMCHHWCWRTSHLLLHTSEETAVWQSYFLTTWIQWSGQHTPVGSCDSWQKQWKFHCLLQTPCFHDRFPLFQSPETFQTGYPSICRWLLNFANTFVTARNTSCSISKNTRYQMLW